MRYLFLVLSMVFLHIVDDYYLQGWLASAKQKKYWQENAPDKMYKYDYIWAFLMHSFSWSFMIMLPIAFVTRFDLNVLFLIAFAVNMIVHAVVDDLKANRRKINLWKDQLIHICLTHVCRYNRYLIYSEDFAALKKKYMEGGAKNEES